MHLVAHWKSISSLSHTHTHSLKHSQGTQWTFVHFTARARESKHADTPAHTVRSLSYPAWYTGGCVWILTERLLSLDRAEKSWLPFQLHFFPYFFLSPLFQQTITHAPQWGTHWPSYALCQDMHTHTVASLYWNRDAHTGTHRKAQEHKGYVFQVPGWLCSHSVCELLLGV